MKHPYKLSWQAATALGLNGLGAVFWLWVGVYWVAALCACLFFFIAGAEWGIAMWRPLALEANDLLAEAVAHLKRAQGQR